MTTYQQISNAIASGKTLAMNWADEFIDADNQGGKSGCGPLQLCVLVQWIGVLESYLSDNFDDDGAAKTPDIDCLTLDEALEIVGKINALTC